MKLRWFQPRKVRQTSELYEHLLKMRNAQRDLLPAPDLASLDATLRETKAALDASADDDTAGRRAAELAGAAQLWLKPYPNAEWRDQVEVFLVAIVVAMSIRTFFLQPFKIPTGSMQPTLFGVTVKDLRDDPAFAMPPLLTRLFDLVAQGAVYHQAIARDDGEFDHAEPLMHFLRFINKQTFWVRYRDGATAPITVWGAPDETPFDLFEHRVGLVDQFNLHNTFRKGEPIIQFVETTGDHLFVDRFTYNFRRPRRGEIIVFKTRDIPQIGQDQFYIKRLIGLPGETVSIGRDRHVRINGRRLDSSTPHFQNVYGFDPDLPPRDSQYSGHLLQQDSHSRLKTSRDKLEVGDKRYAVFGDNTANSWDSRYWGDFPQKNIIGKAGFIYWPFQRFGFGQRDTPLKSNN
jgi:signal peptidase I